MPRMERSACTPSIQVPVANVEMRRTMPSTTDISNRSEPSATAFFAISQRDLDRHTSVVAVNGELDLASAPRLKWTLIDLLDADRSQLVVDLSLVTFMDSTALGVLIGVNRGLDAGARLAIVCTQTNVLKIFEFSGLDGALAIFSTLDEALAYARRSAAPTG
jgi:anti-sigma B factor antagonist